MFNSRLINVVLCKKQLKYLMGEFLNIGSSTVLGCFFVGACLPLTQSELLAPEWIFVSFLFCLSSAFLFHKYRLILLLIAAFLSGFYWTTDAFKIHQQGILPSELESQNLFLSGSIEGLPLVRDDMVNFVLKVDTSDYLAPLNGGLVKLSCYRCSLDIKPDQRWQLTVRLKQPHGYASWGAFDYEKYLFRHRYVAKGYVRLKEINKQLTNSRFSIDQLRYAISKQLANSAEFSEPGFAMMMALMIGDKSFMHTEQMQVFQATGVSHLMAISGLHIGLVFLVVCWLCRWLSYPFARFYLFVPRQHAVLLPALLAALFYAALAGFAVSTTRALIMLSVFVVCKLLAREVSLHKVLLIAACLIVLLDPFSILDVGFWLSCGAVWVIGFVSQTDKPMSLLRLQPLLWLGMMPMTAFFFGQVSWVSPVINLVVVPLFCLLLIPLTLFSMCLLVMGFDGVGVWLLIYLDHAYVFIYNTLSVISNYEIINATTKAWRYWQTGLVSVSLLFYLFKEKVLAYAVWFLMIASLFLPTYRLSVVGASDLELEVVLLDVGQGLSMVIHVNGKHNYTLVYDTGPRYPSGFSAAKAVLIPYLQSRGVSHVDQLIISHADNDHIGGYSDLINAVSVNQVLTSRVDVLPKANACLAGQAWQIDNVSFEILSPMNNTPRGSNNLSCVLKVSYGHTGVLITGDIEKPVERFLLNAYQNDLNKLKATILLVPHQGSKTSSTANFIDIVEPEIALIAAGYLNHYGHPHPNVIERYENRGINVLSTIDNGSVIIKINQQGWRKVAFRDVERRFWNHQKKSNLPR